MLTLFSENYLARKPIEKAVQDFARLFDTGKKILDVGCGEKPYAHYFTCQYVGLGSFQKSKADVIADAWNTEFPDNSFDGILLNQSLEHIEKTAETIREVKRILKPGGRVLVTVPQTMPNHGYPLSSQKAPYQNFDTGQMRYWKEDYWRFTKFGLVSLFRDFTIEKAVESNSYVTTLIQLWNYFLASFGLGILFAPFYFINNTCALLLEAFFTAIASLPLSSAKKYDELINRSLTLNYILVARLEK
jgi:SAM-dependent methyltransferase